MKYIYDDMLFEMNRAIEVDSIPAKLWARTYNPIWNKK